MDTLFIESCSDKDESVLRVNLETFLTLYVFKMCFSETLNLKIVLEAPQPAEPLFEIDHSAIVHEITDFSEVPSIATYCTWPVILVGKTVVAGLASVSRQIIKSSSNANVKKFLGFRDACLMACSESSVWTKFCEIDIVSMIKSTLAQPEQYFPSESLIRVPIHVSRFEAHMNQPVRLHNVYKAARIKNNNKLIKSSVPVADLNIEHVYAEGPYMTLSDLLLFPCFYVFFKVFGGDLLAEEIPRTVSWFKYVQNQLDCEAVCPKFVSPLRHLSCNYTIVQETVSKESLYRSNPSPDKPRNRVFTRQDDIESALKVVDPVLKLHSSKELYGYSTAFDWGSIPFELNPKGGALPAKRADRKCEQLENLVKAVLQLARGKNLTIVDFCSGSGHLGLLIAALLPNSSVILVENKEISLNRARNRVLSLNLCNVYLLQCNLDYFKAHFDLGMALHACGVATDLVLQTCVKNKADFVCCPCCYGGIHDCHVVTYPRSAVFLETGLSGHEYLSIGHAADQTHDKDNVKTAQGFVCMDVIDTDRKLHAEQCGYVVHLGKLDPPSCTPKNNLLVGWFNGQAKEVPELRRQ